MWVSLLQWSPGVTNNEIDHHSLAEIIKRSRSMIHCPLSMICMGEIASFQKIIKRMALGIPTWSPNVVPTVPEYSCFRPGEFSRRLCRTYDKAIKINLDALLNHRRSRLFSCCFQSNRPWNVDIVISFHSSKFGYTKPYVV